MLRKHTDLCEKRIIKGDNAWNKFLFQSLSPFQVFYLYYFSTNDSFAVSASRHLADAHMSSEDLGRPGDVPYLSQPKSLPR
jgi:hypothetical protein